MLLLLFEIRWINFVFVFFFINTQHPLCPLRKLFLFFSLFIPFTFFFCFFSFLGSCYNNIPLGCYIQQQGWCLFRDWCTQFQHYSPISFQVHKQNCSIYWWKKTTWFQVWSCRWNLCQSVCECNHCLRYSCPSDAYNLLPGTQKWKHG